MLRKIGFLVFILCVLLMVISVNCAKKKGVLEKKTITFFVFSEARQKPVYEGLVKSFEKRNPHIKVVLQTTAWTGTYTKLLTMIAGNVSPDVFILGGGLNISNDFTSRGACEDLTPFLKDSTFDKDDYFSQSLELCKFKGHLYGLPFSMLTYVLFYNVDMFDKAGVAYPEQNWDWDRFLEACKKLTKDIDGDGRIDQFGFYYWNTESLWRTLIMQNDGSLFDDFENPSKCTIDQPSAYNAIQFLADLVHKYHVSPTFAQREGSDLLSMGKVGMVMGNSSWLPIGREKWNFKWDVAPFIKGKRRLVPFTVHPCIISTQSRYKEEAWEFIKFACGPEGQRIIGKGGLGMPSMKNIASSAVFLRPDEKPEHIKVFVEAMEYSENMPYNLGPDESKIMSMINNSLDLAFISQIPAKEACEKAAKEADEILRQKR